MLLQGRAFVKPFLLYDQKAVKQPYWNSAATRLATTTAGAPPSTVMSAAARYRGTRFSYSSAMTFRLSGTWSSGRRLSFFSRS